MAARANTRTVATRADVGMMTTRTHIDMLIVTLIRVQVEERNINIRTSHDCRADAF
ncbi:hypothetical protein RO3G_13974 [Rhizopus delemar RA 99-880]|uniref:Uncharacterized protein n=1 Tax=Rhizopus delemar (strain RA 99-880 / ATCC MYA-4621 / FGSC 9543 / NRRL 43880) TaxID=246409 RepID=I1CLD3_RHIO9|nr:hypothetical protein RO3G_13974 [Rhizopus delemar RA 99-880]|eukprot:EIE89263.1 hypothetical protein RO3G_13974 [Rhizopus delemar RA 99-880]